MVESKKKGRWKAKKYGKELMAYVNKDIAEHERPLYQVFFDEIADKYNLNTPGDLIMLDLVCYDYLRIKRLHRILEQKGEMTELRSKSGFTYMKANEASYLLNAVETQLRGNMRELLLTRKEMTRKNLIESAGKDDFATFMGKVAQVEEVKDGVHESTAVKDDEDTGKGTTSAKGGSSDFDTERAS